MKYNYAELLSVATENATEENIAALAEWFTNYGMEYWNGEFFDADGYRLFPVYAENADGDIFIERYELR